MPKPINILVVEDSEADTSLLLHELKRNGYLPRHCRVETAGDLRAAIEQHHWDVVVSDYSMPQFSGADALAVFTELKRDCPFIFVSGTLGEDAAVRMMKAGASDYIVKGDLRRFVPALEREMEYCRTRYAHRSSEAALHHLAAIVQASKDAIFSNDSDSFITSWNPAAEQIYGYPAEEIIGRSIAVLFPKIRRDELLENMTRIRQGELVAMYDTQRRHKDGSVIPISTSIAPIKNAAGEVVGAASIDRDISYQKRERKIHLKLINELTEALRQSNTISGQLRVCAACKRICGDSDDSWLQVEAYLAAKSEASVTHDICPECATKYNAKVHADS